MKRSLLFVVVGGVMVVHAQKITMKATVTPIEEAKPRVRSDLSVTREVHGRMVVLKCEDGGSIVSHRADVMKPSLSLVGSRQVGKNWEYTYQLRNDAGAEAEVNQVVLWTGGERPSIFYTQDGVQPGQTVQFVIVSPFSPGKGVKVSMSYANHLKLAQERAALASFMEKPVSEECRASIDRTHDSRAWLTVDGPLASAPAPAAQ